jgi:hypothetical protein
MKHAIDRAVYRDLLADVAFHKLKSLVTSQVCDVLGSAGAQVVEAEHFMALAQQGLAEMAPQKSGASRDNNSHYFLPML